MHRVYLLFCFGQIIRNLDRICHLVKCRCDFSEYSISSPTKRIFYPNWTLPKRRSFFLCKITNITSRICTQRIFAPKIMLVEKIAGEDHLALAPADANRIYQQLSSFARPHAPARSPHTARAPPAPTSLRITVDGLYCTPTENLSRFCKIFAIFRINCFPVWNN